MSEYHPFRARKETPVSLDFGSVGDTICQILHKIYIENPRFFARKAREFGTSKESLAAAAICGMLAELMEGKAATKDPTLN